MDSLTPYAEAMRNVAAEKHVPLLDLHASSGKLYGELGEEGTAKLEGPGPDPHTSTRPERAPLPHS